MPVLFVESPAKVERFKLALLKKNKDKKFKVLTTKGHLRKVVVNKFNNENSKIIWSENAQVKVLVKQLKEINFNNEKFLLLATDKDREGEAIAWHILEILKKYFKYNSFPYRISL